MITGCLATTAESLVQLVDSDALLVCRDQLADFCRRESLLSLTGRRVWLILKSRIWLLTQLLAGLSELDQ
jgi:hypothetical protein